MRAQCHLRAGGRFFSDVSVCGVHAVGGQDGGPPPCIGGGGDGEGPDCAYDNDPLDGCIFVPIPWGGSGRGGGGGGTGPVKQPAEPNINPSGKPPLSGETLGIPNSVHIPIPSILQTLGLAPNDPACDFIACGTGSNGFQAGAIAGTLVCHLLEPCGGVEDALILGTLAVEGGLITYNHFAKGGTQNVVPSWAEGNQPLPGESASQMADRLCKQQYPPDGAGCGTGPTSERNRIRKWAHRKWGI